MNKLFYTLILLLLALSVTACTSAPIGNTSEQQRKNAKDGAREAQEELSTDVKRGAR